MPERTVTGLTQALLKFAAGDDRAREQVSSTWCMRFTRVADLYLFNREAGGNAAHVSIHKDGRCHYKIDDRGTDGRARVRAEWELLLEADIIRLATVVIPHRGLVVPDGFAGVDPETVLIPPPPAGKQLEVDVFLERGHVPDTAWPGQTSELRTSLVGRGSLYVESPDDAFGHFTVVSTVRDEGPNVVTLSKMSIPVPDGTVPVLLRAVMFEEVHVDGQHLPVLTEMPVGHWG